MHRLIIAIAFLFTIPALHAQEQSGFENTDAATFGMYMRGDWNDLVKTGENALQHDEDFFYLRYRLGIAYYELKQYRLALPHFEKAYAERKDDELLKEYLFYCYLYTEQYAHALMISRHFSHETMEKTEMHRASLVHLVNVEYGLKLSSDTTLYRTMVAFQAGVGFRVGRSMTGFAGFTHLSQNMYYGTLEQVQYYASIGIPLSRSWMVSPGFHYIHYSFADVKSITTYVLPEPPPPPGAPAPALVPVTTTPNYDGSAYVTSLTVSKNLKDFSFSAGGSYSTLSKGKQYQQELNVAWYPLHSNKLCTYGGVTFFSDDAGTSFHPIVSGGLRYFMGTKWCIAGGYSYIEAKNFNSQNGWLVNNSFDITHQRFHLGIDRMIGKNISLYGTYLYESKTESYYLRDYHFNMIIAGIKLVF